MDEIYSYLDSPSEAIFDDYEELIYHGHPIGRNILGNKKTIKTFNKQMAKAYMDKNYNTDQMILSSVGNISFDKLVRYAEKHLASIPSNKRKHSVLGINEYENLLFEFSYPQVATILQKKGRPYPKLDKFGQILS